MKRLAVIYDGECPLCVSLAKRLRSIGAAAVIELVPLQDEAAAALLPEGYDRSLPEEEMHVVELPSGAVYRGADGIFRIMAELPALRPLAAVYRIPGLRPLASAVYGWVARHRYGLFGTADERCETGSCKLHRGPDKPAERDRPEETLP